MDQKAFAAAKEKLQIAKTKYEAMQTATDLPHLAQLWSEFLTEQHRVFLRLRKATERNSSKGWCDAMIAEQRTDDLLKYCLHARNAHEHGIEKITNSTPSALEIGSKTSSFFIKEMTIKNVSNVIHIASDPETYQNMILSWSPGSVNFIPVSDRGQTYYPPAKHLDKTIECNTPISAAHNAVLYLEKKIVDAEYLFINEVVPLKIRVSS